MKQFKSGRLFLRLMALAAVLVMMFCEVSFAEGLEVQPDKSTIFAGDSVTVNVTGARKNEQVTVLMYDKTDKARTNLNKEEILYVNQKAANANGECTFTFRLPSKNTGIKIAAIGLKSSESALTTEVTVVKGEYTITFQNYDGSVLQTGQVKHNELPSYTGETPKKPDDSSYTYTFKGWEPLITAALEDKTYTAVFNSAGKQNVASAEITTQEVNQQRKTSSFGIKVTPNKEINSLVVTVNGKTVVTYSPSDTSNINFGLLVRRIISPSDIKIYADDQEIPVTVNNNND